MLQSVSTPPASDHLDVLVVGAGLSGIDAAYHLQKDHPELRFALFEARDAIGGTWDLFRYPGIRSDSDMATLGFPFRPWRGEKSIADGADIRRYIVETARKFGIDRKVRFDHRVTAADWSSAESRWTVDYRDGGIARRVTCGFLFLCSGYYDYAGGHAPEWPGREAFEGTVVHPQFWPEDLDVAGKDVVVIGSGATAVTLAPSLAKLGTRSVTMLQRSPTYIVSQPSRDRKAGMMRRILPAPVADAAIRWKNVGFSIVTYRLARSRPEKFKRFVADAQRRYLGDGFDMLHLTPRYEPWDQRLCLVPDGDLFRALKAGRVAIVTDTIDRFTADGIRTGSGTELPADIVVSATGLKVQMMGGATLSVDGVAVETGSRLLYKGAMLDGVPNFAFAVGYTNASWTLKCDLTAQLVSRLLGHMQRRGFDAVTPRADAADRSDEPMLDFKAGYVLRAADVMPRQGVRAPWRVHQNYLADWLSFRFGRVSDGALDFRRNRAKRKRDAAKAREAA